MPIHQVRVTVMMEMKDEASAMARWPSGLLAFPLDSSSIVSWPRSVFSENKTVLPKPNVQVYSPDGVIFRVEFRIPLNEEPPEPRLTLVERKI